MSVALHRSFTVMKNVSMFVNPTADLCKIASAGGSLCIHTDVRATEDLIEIASCLRQGATITMSGRMLRPADELRTIAQAAPGQIISQA